MRKRFGWPLCAAVASCALWALTTVGAASAATIVIPSSGSTAIGSASVGTPSAATDNEFQFLQAIGDENAGDEDASGAVVDRSVAPATVGSGPTSSGLGRAKSNPELAASWQGLNFFDQRFANNGNQFSVEPPDQGLCVGNGYVLESVNDVLAVYDTSGHLLKGPVDLNTFYGYPAAIDRSAAGTPRGPSITDPVCYYDKATGRFFQVVLTLEQTTAGALLGPNHLDIAVSDTSSPLGSWTIYKIPAQNDGTQGTPNHGCVKNRAGTIPGACLADYPHIGADRNGIYITANEFDLFGPFFHGAEIYALSKAQLTSGAFSIGVSLLQTGGPDGAGFTVWPAITPGDQYDGAQGGTEYFLSSRAVFTDDGTSNSILVWRLTNTSSLDDASPSLGLSAEDVAVDTYGVPPKADQKAGSVPLAQCLGVLSCATAIAGRPTTSTEVESKLDANDSRFTGVTYANGKLWGTLGTAVSVGGATKDGAAWYILHPTPAGSSLLKQGVLAVAGNNLTYSTVGVTSASRGVLAFTLVGADYFPSAAYTSIDDKVGAGDTIHVAALGAGPQDGFSGYKNFRNPPRPRWGDYGAAVADGGDVYVASEYVDQTCDFATYVSTNGLCGNTRAPLGNWATRISRLTP
ncbi:MAG: hypothetical protein ACXVZ3_11800 [Gaiellaceae bacterium]